MRTVPVLISECLFLNRERGTVGADGAVAATGATLE
jgi:hypothetical protein